MFDADSLRRMCTVPLRGQKVEQATIRLEVTRIAFLPEIKAGSNQTEECTASHDLEDTHPL